MNQYNIKRDYSIMDAEKILEVLQCAARRGYNECLICCDYFWEFYPKEMEEIEETLKQELCNRSK